VGLDHALSLLAGAFVAVPSGDVHEHCTLDLVPRGSYPTNKALADAMAANVPWRLRQVRAIQLPAAGCAPSGAAAAAAGAAGVAAAIAEAADEATRAELLLVGGGGIEVSRVCDSYAIDLQDHEVCSCVTQCDVV
jgi:hypothetical protein